MNDAPELYAIVKEWEKELKRKKRKNKIKDNNKAIQQMKDIKYFEQKCERLEAVIKMRECQLRCACDGLEVIHQDSLASVNPAAQIGLIQATTYKTLEAVDAIYELHHGEKIADGFLEPKPRG